MKTIDFCGKKLQTNDISSCAVKKAASSSLFGFGGNIIVFLFYIIIAIVFYLKYKSNEYDGTEAFAIGFFTIIGVGVLFSLIREFFFKNIYIVEVKMISGGSHKSPKMEEYEADALNEKLAKKIS